MLDFYFCGLMNFLTTSREEEATAFFFYKQGQEKCVVTSNDETLHLSVGWAFLKLPARSTRITNDLWLARYQSM
jgi:hypothetical protein